jgi:hypothetical protein
MNDNTNTTTASRKAETLTNLTNQILGGAELKGVTNAQNWTGREVSYEVRFPQGCPIRFWIDVHGTDEDGVAHQIAELTVDISRDPILEEWKATVWHERSELCVAFYSDCRLTGTGWTVLASSSDWNRFTGSLVKGAIAAYTNLV